MSRLESIFKRVKASCKKLAQLHDEERNAVLREVAHAIISHQEELLTANAIDLSQMDSQHPLYDRLLLTPQRLEEITSGILHVASLPSPLGKILKEEKLKNGLHLQRISVPYGVIGMIYEARPNVTYDVFSLCFKSGNAAILKGGKDADHSNRAAVKLIHEVLVKHNIDPNVVALLPAPPPPPPPPP
jgi:glutamate-5-semialdehyde dehydrogenase